MPRSVSSVTSRAAPQSTPDAPIGATQTLSTPSCGAIQARRVPSGEMCGLTRSGLPNSTVRGMRSTMAHAYHTGRSAPTGQPPGSLTGDNPVHQLTREPARGGRVRVVVDVLLLLVLVQARGAELAADAGPAEAAPLGLRQVGVVVVDPHRAVPQRAGDPLGPARVRGPDRARQAVRGVVAKPDRLVLGAEPLDGYDRPEHLFLHHCHLPVALV